MYVFMYVCMRQIFFLSTIVTHIVLLHEPWESSGCRPIIQSLLDTSLCIAAVCKSDAVRGEGKPRLQEHVV